MGELIETTLPEITLAVVEAYPFRTSRQYLELWCTHVIRNDLDHTLKFDETRGEECTHFGSSDCVQYERRAGGESVLLYLQAL